MSLTRDAGDIKMSYFWCLIQAIKQSGTAKGTAIDGSELTTYKREHRTILRVTSLAQKSGDYKVLNTLHPVTIHIAGTLFGCYDQRELNYAMTAAPTHYV